MKTTSVKPNVIITGGSGFVGSVFASLLDDSYTIFTPSRDEMDITKKESVASYFHTAKPIAVIHAAAYTDNLKAEHERGDTKGICYRTNVIGTKNITEACRLLGIFPLYISTGSVFSGTEDSPGPFAEGDLVTPLDEISWYGYTKSQAELYVSGGAILRISHPISGHPKDYLHTLLDRYDAHTLYPLFTDQCFPITDLEMAIQGIHTLLANRSTGVFHMVSDDVVSPYELCLHALKALGRDTHGIQTILFDDYVKRETHPVRFTKYSAIVGINTRKKLGIPAYSWQDVVDKNMSYYEQ